MRTLAPFLLLALAGCASNAPVPPLELAPLRTLRPSHFPGADAVLAGFAPADHDPSMRVGDAVLLGVEGHHRGGSERQLVLLEVTGLPMQAATPGQRAMRQTSRVTVDATVRRSDTGETVPAQRVHDVRALQVRLTRCAADGSVRRTSDVVSFEELLASGFWPYTGPDDDVRAGDLAAALTAALQELAARDAVLQELLFAAVDEPSLWSVATHLGLGIELRFAPRAIPSTVALGEDLGPDAAELRRVSLALLVNGRAAADVQLLVAKPRGALRVCGGLVGAIVQHADDPERLTVVRLLATRRGASPFTR